MKSLREALADYDSAQLQALAHKRGLPPPGGRSREAIAAFAEALLSPAAVAIAVDDLSAAERAALETLLAAGGKLEARKFTRQYGEVRAMGSGRLLREKPWEAPANPTEGLWYRGFIFRGFHHTLSGPEEVFFIPTDLQAALPLAPPEKPAFAVSLAPAPAHILPGGGLLREDLFTLLVYLQTEFVRLSAEDALPPAHRRAIQRAFAFHPLPAESPPPPPAREAADHWFDLILHLARRMDFLRKQGRRLKLHGAAVKTWLQQSAWEQLRRAQDAWRTDPTWNDLWHIPGLHPKPTGWENSPMLGRSRILHYLSLLPDGEWIGLKTFVEAVKQTEPDFQRPGGDYQTWYIYDAEGKPLMGFEHWDAVEGAFIRHLITDLLFAMGVVELGAPGEGLLPAVFQITPLGRAFLSPETASAPPAAPPSPLRIHPTDFTVRVPAAASLYDRFQLARFANLVRRDEKGTLYRIDRRSYRKAMAQSITLEQILAFLKRATGGRTPLPLVEAMRTWERRAGAVRLERLTVLRVAEEEVVPELLNHPRIGPLLGLPLGPKAILVPEKNLAPLRKLLTEEGYFDLPEEGNMPQ